MKSFLCALKQALLDAFSILPEPFCHFTIFGQRALAMLFTILPATSVNVTVWPAQIC